MLFPCTRGRKSSREKILDAAAELVAEIGAGRLTLDAVAEKAGLSKGGLLYDYCGAAITQLSLDATAVRGNLYTVWTV